MTATENRQRMRSQVAPSPVIGKWRKSALFPVQLVEAAIGIRAAPIGFNALISNRWQGVFLLLQANVPELFLKKRPQIVARLKYLQMVVPLGANTFGTAKDATRRQGG